MGYSESASQYDALGLRMFATVVGKYLSITWEEIVALKYCNSINRLIGVVMLFVEGLVILRTTNLKHRYQMEMVLYNLQMVNRLLTH